jgi:YHS domain-containing protein
MLDRARIGRATLMIVLLVGFTRSTSISLAAVPDRGSNRLAAVAAQQRFVPNESVRTALRDAQREVEPEFEATDRGTLYPVTVDPWIQQQELTASDGTRGDVFGYSVAVTGKTAIIGAAGKTIGKGSGQGAAYVFTCSGTPCRWTQQQVLTASDGASDDEFGNSVAVSGNTAIIAAWGKNSLYLPGAPTTAVAPRGAAYVFTCSGAPCRWTQQQELTPSDGASGDEFGNTVAMSGNTAIIGAPYKNSYQGAVYLFTCTGTPCSWTQQQELTAAHGARGDVFGYSVAVSGITAIIGAIGSNASRGGAAYVFTCSGTPCTWTQQQELTASDGASGDEFGTRVAVSGATAIIGAPGKTIGNHTLQGAAYVFTCSGTPCRWTQQQELTASDGASRDQFGNRVAVSGNTVIVGNNSSQGAAYVFTCSGTPCTWKARGSWPFGTRKQQQELTAADGAHGDEFGYSVAVSGNTAVIGAAYKNSYQGAAYVFKSSAVAGTGATPTSTLPP